MRIVSLLPSATEMVCALGLGDQLVGVSHECDFPAPVTALPRVTSSILDHGLSQAEIDARVSEAVRAGRSLYDVDRDLLASLAPDLVVTQGLCDVCAVSEDTVQSAMGDLPRELVERAQVLSLDGRSWEGVLTDLQRLAAATGAPAGTLLDRLRDRWQALPGPSESAPVVVLLEWADPPFSGGHWVPEQVAAAGFRDGIGAPGTDSRRLTWNEVAAAQPDVLGLICCGYDLAANARFASVVRSRPELAGTPALRNNAVWAFDANSFFSRPAPRLVRGAELLAHVRAGGDDLPGEAARC